MAAKRIQWNGTEENTIVARAQELRASGHTEVPWRLIDAAQKILPAERQRHLVNISSINKELRKRIEDLYKPGIRTANVVAPAPVPQPEVPKPEETIAPRLGIGLEVVDALKALVTDLVADAIKEGFLRALPDILENPTVKDYMAPGLRVKPDMPKVSFLPPLQPETMKGPRIAVIGLHPSKQRSLYELVDNLFPLRVWDMENSSGKAEDIARWGYRVFFRTDRAAHSTERNIKAAGVWDKVIRVNSERELFDYIDMYVREYKSNARIPAKDVKPTPQQGV